MSKTIQQIKKELDKIEEKVSLTGEEIYKAYKDYLNLLIQVVAKQFILASYQICTQIYPEAFLKISFSQREHLQQQLRKISQENFQDLLDYFSSEEDTLNIRNPGELADWLDNLEASLVLKLEEISKLGNNCLQKVGILPEDIPAKIIAMAMEAEENLPNINSSPNLLNILTEKENNISQVTVLRLSLIEIEFSESNLTTQRNKIRTIKQEIKQLEQKYQRQIKELAIAEAETAWRSSWHL
ncbi:MAG: hypothetical protein EA365_00225 [Gloeocapsa sp. DLM2.Bin57]|nr:MAG: hypothetical protein EA365_00225 [Gloeocapsa sp. DLM2.Bin57]